MNAHSRHRPADGQQSIAELTDIAEGNKIVCPSPKSMLNKKRIKLAEEPGANEAR